jgi:hypothetical protein
MARNDLRSDSLIITLQFTPDLKPANPSYYLIAYSQGTVCYTASLPFKENGTQIRLSKTLFPTGIAHLVLLNQSYQPLNERLVYVDRNDPLNIELQTNKPFYAPKDSVALNLVVKDAQGKPLTGSFSLAVTDDELVKADTSGTGILTHMLLTSDLKGYIENPAYYLKKENQPSLDLLLLTQGWIGYDWTKMLQQQPALRFAAEPEFAIKGKVSNVFNKAVAGVAVTLLSNRPMVLMQTNTGADGRFVFKGFPKLDTAVFHIQVRNKKGNSNNVGIEAEEFIPPVFPKNIQQESFSAINTDTANINAARKLAGRKDTLNLPRNARQLKQVVVKARKTVKGSHNLNGDGNADYVLTEQDMIAAKKMTLVELLKQKIKGFGISGIPKSIVFETDYMIFKKRVHLIIDGINADRFFTPANSNDSPVKIQDEHFHYTQTFMEYYTAEDIKGIEVLYEMNFPYVSTFGTGDATKLNDPLAFAKDQQSEAYIEITTRSGHGPMMSKTPGTYLYKPLPFAWPKQFYRPRYTVNNTEAELTPRPTIHWEPNIMTDAEGKASVSFYAATKPGTYTLILQGTDLNGKLAYETRRIILK